MEKKKINFLIKKDLLKQFDIEAEKVGLNRTALLTILINNYIAKEKNEYEKG